MSLPGQQTHPHVATFLGKVKTNAKVVAAIDFGTAYSCISFVYKDNPSVVNCGAPGLSASRDAIKVPTVLLQSPECWLFGHEAIETYHDYVEDLGDNDTINTTIDPLSERGIHLYRFFKMRLRKEETGAEWITAKSTSGHAHKLIDLVSESLRALGSFARNEIQSGFGGALGIRQKDILWVLTVPAIWNDFGKSFMRKTAFRAGLVPDETSDKLLLAIEPECASIAVHQEGSKFGLFKQGSVFMVLDCGGGTVDITMHKVATMEPLVLDEAATPNGGAWGGMFVDLQFMSFLKDFLGTKMLDRLKKKHPNELEGLREEFRELKENFGGGGRSKNANRISFANLPREDLGLSALEKLAADYNMNAGSIAFDLSEGSQVAKKMRRDSILTFTDKQMQEFFEPTMQKICECVTSILHRTRDVSAIVLVGGYGSSKVLGERVRKTFEAKPFGVKVVIPDSTVRPQAAIVHGASYFGLYSSVIGVRIAKKTYGIATNRKWFDGCRYSEADAEWDARLKEKRVDNVFVSLVKRASKINPAETFKSGSYSPLHPDQKSVVFRVFESDLHCPEFTTKDCKKLGEVEVPCRNKDDSFDVQFTFGSELRVEIIRQDGDRHFGLIDFDYT